MSAGSTRGEINEFSGKVIGCAYGVGKGLGCLFLEKVYENALAHEIRKAGLGVAQQRAIKIRHDRMVGGDYVADKAPPAPGKCRVGFARIFTRRVRRPVAGPGCRRGGCGRLPGTGRR